MSTATGRSSNARRWRLAAAGAMALGAGVVGVGQLPASFADVGGDEGAPNMRNVLCYQHPFGEPNPTRLSLTEVEAFSASGYDWFRATVSQEYWSDADNAYVHDPWLEPGSHVIRAEYPPNPQPDDVCKALGYGTRNQHYMHGAWA